MIKKSLTIFLFFLSVSCLAQNTALTGYCSFYADKFNGRRTASGEKYNKNLFTAAHRTLPFNTVVMVTNLRNQKQVLVKINDRGPHKHSRILDISKAAAIELDIIHSGVEKVKIEVVDVPPSYLKQDTIIWGQDSVKADNKGIQKPIAETKEDPETMIYDSDHKAAHPIGYGIQVGYYKNPDNCSRELEKFQSKYKTPGYVLKEKKTQNTYYRLIIGAFKDRKQALTLQVQLKKQIPGCFIYKWNSQ
mgnify:CR=1 FL=1